MAEMAIRLDEEALHRRWLNIAGMRGRYSGAPLAPRWGRFRVTGERGVSWLDLMEIWERDGFSGGKPVVFEAYVRFYGGTN